jgi:phosphatidylserine synthase
MKNIYGKAICSGFVFWAAMFTLVSMFIALGFYNQYDAIKFLVSISSGIIAVLFVSYLKIEKMKQALIFSLTWLVVGLLLDYFFSMKFNSQIFNSMYLWLGYGLMFVSPIVYVSLIKKKSIWKR